MIFESARHIKVFHRIRPSFQGFFPNKSVLPEQFTSSDASQQPPASENVTGMGHFGRCFVPNLGLQPRPLTNQPAKKINFQ